jgi:hypothetical protein
LMPRIFQKWPFNWNSLSISIKLVSRSTYLILWLIYWNVLKMKLQQLKMKIFILVSSTFQR